MEDGELTFSGFDVETGGDVLGHGDDGGICRFPVELELVEVAVVKVSKGLTKKSSVV